MILLYSKLGKYEKMICEGTPKMDVAIPMDEKVTL